MSDDKKRKRSWKEIDNAKDKSRHRRVERPGTDPYSRRGQSKSYKAELDRFFDSGVASTRITDLMKDAASEAKSAQKVDTPEKTRLIRQVRHAETFDGFVAAVNTLRKTYDLPDDADILTRMLEHPEDEAIQDALNHLIGMAKRLSLREMQAISARLDSIQTISDDGTTLELVEKLRAKM